VTELIAEVGNVHEGSLGIAMSIVDMIANSGAKIAKFQFHIAQEEGIPDEPFRISFSKQDRTRQEYWARVNFSLESWLKLKVYCDEKGVEFLCTPFSRAAAVILHKNQLVKRWKIGSGDATNWQLIDYVTETKLPLIISTGLISEFEIDLLVERLLKNKALERTTLLHCVSKYPANLNDIDLHLMTSLKKYGCNVGFSDHTGVLTTSIYASIIGASIVEVHVTPHKLFFGPDVSSSLTPDSLSFLVKTLQDISILTHSAGTKKEHFDSVAGIRPIFRKGLYWATNLSKGHVVSTADLRFLKPVIGIDSVNADSVIGRVLSENVTENSPVLQSQITGALNS
jgi:N,N'-diacetyllegionaminate synthase